ncbi:MAG: hypothetical protein GDA36_03730 [Rhodobacteraceae bacterium]|nr:hypothetical protein [Paracoccaceae bacterium]
MAGVYAAEVRLHRSSEINCTEGMGGADVPDGYAGDGSINTGTGEGSDRICGGGEGIDTASYLSSDAGMTVNLAIGEVQGRAIPCVTSKISTGPAHDDTLTGDSSNNRINGGHGC